MDNQVITNLNKTMYEFITYLCLSIAHTSFRALFVVISNVITIYIITFINNMILYILHDTRMRI